MEYKLHVKPKVDKIFEKLSKRDRKKLKIISSKLKEIITDPNRYKNLRFSLKNFKRVHIDKHFVLVFSIDERNKIVIVEDFDHNDKVYK